MMKKNITLLGDACHPTLPYQAQGAAMALEDGLILGTLLSSASGTSEIPSMLKKYESARKARTTRTVLAAARNRRVFHVADGIGQMVRDFVLGLAGVTRESDWTFLFWRRMGGLLQSSDHTF